MATSTSDDEVSSSESDLLPAEISVIHGGTVDINIGEINSTLTEVHQQYHKLLQKYSRALNLIDDLKCQLACDGCSKEEQPDIDSFHQLYEENRSQINDSHSWQWSASQINTASIAEQSPQQVCSYDYIKHSTPSTPLSEDIEHSRKIIPHTSGADDENDAGLQLFTELFSSRESNICASSSTSNSSLHDVASSAHTVSCCQTQVEKPLKDHNMSYYQSIDEQSQGNFTKSNLVEQQEKQLIQGQQACHQIAVVYPARRNIKLCTMGCCGRHSCCCCPHTPHSQTATVNQNKTPVVAEISDEVVTSSLQGTKTSNSPVAASKLLQALQEAVKRGGELRKSSSDLLHCFE